MPDVGTPQATWRDDEYVRDLLDEYLVSVGTRNYAETTAEAAVAARDREVAATLRAEIEALPLSAPGHTATVGMKRYRAGVLAVVDAVLGADS